MFGYFFLYVCISSIHFFFFFTFMTATTAYGSSWTRDWPMLQLQPHQARDWTCASAVIQSTVIGFFVFFFHMVVFYSFFKIFIMIGLQCSVIFSCRAKWPFVYFFLTLSSIMFHHKWLGIYFSMLYSRISSLLPLLLKCNSFHLLNQDSQSIPLLPPSSHPLANMSLLYMSMIFSVL